MTIGLQYIRYIEEYYSEVTYTSTLPLNQEGILSTQFSALVFFSVSTRPSSSQSHLHLQVIWIWIISRSRSSSLDWIWIITRSGSLEVIITGSGSQLDLDLLWSPSYMLSHDSSCHRKFYRSSLISCWVYAYLLVGLWQPLYLTYSSEWLALTSNLLVRKVVALISDHIGPNPTVTSEWPALASDLVGTKSYTLTRMAPSPRLSYLVTDQVPPFSQRMAVALTSNLLVGMASTHI